MFFNLSFLLDCTTVLIRLLNLDCGYFGVCKLTVETLHDVGKAKVVNQATWSCMKDTHAEKETSF